MKIVFNHHVTWREHSTTTKWQVERIGSLSLLLHVKHATATKRICLSLLAQHVPTTCLVLTCCFPKVNLPCYKMRLGFNMLLSEGQLPLLQEDFRFSKVFHPPNQWNLIRCNSQPSLQNAGPNPILEVLFPRNHLLYGTQGLSFVNFHNSRK